MQDSLYNFDFASGESTKLAGPVFDNSRSIINDGGVDCRGRCVFGATDMDFHNAPTWTSRAASRRMSAHSLRSLTQLRKLGLQCRHLRFQPLDALGESCTRCSGCR